MKKFLTAVVALGLIYCAAAYVIGIKVGDFLQAALDRAVANSPGLGITLKQSHRGIFTSTFLYAVSFTLPAEPGKPESGKNVSLDLNIDVAHGPIPLAKSFAPCLALADTTYSINPTSSPDVRNFFGKLPELLHTASRTSLGFDLSGTTQITVPGVKTSFQPENGTPMQFEWQPLTAVVWFDGSLTAASLDARWPSLRVQDQKTSLTLSDIHFTSNSKQSKGNIWTGRSRVDLGSLEISPAAPGAPMVLENAFMNLELRPHDATLDYSVDLGVTGKTSGGGNIPASIGVVLHGLDMAALEELQAALRRQSDPTAKDKPDEAEFTRIANAFLIRSPWLDLNGKAFEGDGGPVTIQASVKTQDMRELPRSIPLALARLRAQAKLDGTVRSVHDLLCLVVQDGAKRPADDPGFRKQMGNLIDQLVLQGILAHKDGHLMSEALWDGSALTVNGRKLF